MSRAAVRDILFTAGSGFNPQQVPGLVAYFDFNDQDTITFNSTEIDSITDKYGSGLSLSAETAGKRTQWSSTGFNGKGGMALNPETEYLANDSDFRFSPDMTILMAVDYTNPGTNSAIAGDAKPNVGGWGISTMTTGMRFQIRRSGGTTNVDMLNTVSGLAILSAYVDSVGGQSSFRLNMGYGDESDYYSLSENVGSTMGETNQALRVGDMNTGGISGDVVGYVGAIMLFDRAVSYP